jgi:hypothetical protein
VSKAKDYRNGFLDTEFVTAACDKCSNAICRYVLEHVWAMEGGEGYNLC